jgi:hypothetical protein
MLKKAPIRMLPTGLLILLCVICAGPGLRSQGTEHQKTQLLAFISDPQAPFWIESLALGDDRNEAATDSLFADIERVRPAHLFILGDLVSFGAYPRAWEGMDRRIGTLRGAHISVSAILGNHELMFLAQTGERNFQEAFPDHRNTGYLRVVDSVGIVLLNSNFGSLTEKDRLTQDLWYARVLDSLQREPAIRCIVVCCHHAPFTNSTVVGSSAAVQHDFVPAFVSTRKCVLFLAGHAHTFEHFRQRGKDFMVIGGGGGSRHRLHRGSEQIWADLSPERKPLFHYLTLERRESALMVRVRQLRDDFAIVEDGYCAVVNVHGGE